MTKTPQDMGNAKAKILLYTNGSELFTPWSALWIVVCVWVADEGHPVWSAVCLGLDFTRTVKKNTWSQTMNSMFPAVWFKNWTYIIYNLQTIGTVAPRVIHNHIS